LILLSLLLASVVASAVEFNMRSLNPTRVMPGSGRVAIEVGNFDSDRRQDMVMCFEQTMLKIFRQDQAGEQVLRVDLPTWNEAFGPAWNPNYLRLNYCRVHVVDLDGNNLDDIVVTHLHGVFAYTFLPDGSIRRIGPVFDTGINYEYDGFSDSALGDFDSDGDQDLVVLRRRSGELLTFRNLGGGQFAQPIPSARVRQSLAWAATLSVGDLNSDGFADVAVATVSPDGISGGITSVFYNDGASQLVERATFHHPPTYEMSVSAIGDVTGDGKDDLVLANPGNQPKSIIVVYEQGGEGELKPMVVYPTYDIPSTLHIADFDGDGRNDLLLLHATWNAITTYRQQSAGTLDFHDILPRVYSLQAVSRRANPNALAMSDFRADGCKDILLATEHYSLADGTGCLPASNADVASTLDLSRNGVSVQIKNADSVNTAFAVVGNIRLSTEGVYGYMPPAPEGCSSSPANLTGRVYVCRFATLAPGESRTFFFPLSFKPSRAVFQRTSASVRVSSHGSDPMTSNNSSVRELRSFVRRSNGRRSSPIKSSTARPEVTMQRPRLETVTQSAVEGDRSDAKY
jgi:hypothetical protein